MKYRCLVCKNVQRKIFCINEFKYWKCRRCGFVSTYPLPSEKEIENHYEFKYKSGNYSLLLENREKYKVVYEGFVNEIEKYIEKHCINKKKKTVLDIGCFTGDFLHLLKEKGYGVYGVELQSDACKIARDLLGGNVYCEDVHSFEIKREFDIVSLSGLIEHVVKPIDIIKKSLSLLKKDGIIFIQTPDASSNLAKLMGKYWPPYSPIEHIHIFSKESLKIVLKENNISNLDTKRHVKKLPVNYVYENFKNFGPHYHRLLIPFNSILKNMNLSLPFYVGEIMVLGRKTE
jgi:2-polyprenyl-3-methyl-5-hydroxy-6-metoxy-1,4-benzoquinol methylase